MTDALTRVRELATERVGQRLAHTLLRLMRHCGERAAGGVLIPIPLTRQELADLTGTRALELDTVLLGPCRVAPEPLGAWRTRCRLGDMAARRNPLPASGVGGILVRSPIIRKERPCTVR